MAPLYDSLENSEEEDGNVFHYLCRNESAESLQSFKMLISEVNRYLLREFDPSGRQCIHIAAGWNTTKSQVIFKHLIRWGADINAQDKINGDTPLHIAVRRRNFELVNWICYHPTTKINVINFDHKTPWCIAYDSNSWSIMWLLQIYGASYTVTPENRN